VTLVLRGGRVVDPASGLDAVRDVAIDGASITAIGEALPAGDRDIDVSGLVVAPGFIDLHSHAQSVGGRRLQACDGVTAALDLEAGRVEIDAAYREEAAEGSPIHYGFSASWAGARMHAVAGTAKSAGFGMVIGTLGDPAWQREATGAEVTAILEQLERDLAAGGIGIGLLMGYAPGVEPSEYLAIADLAARHGVPTFTHVRDLVEVAPTTKIDGSEELVRAAGETGAHMHHCHINSTSVRHIDRVLALVDRCQRAGSAITIEAYPYGSGSTAIGAAFLAPERLAERGLTPRSLTYMPTRERVADDARLRELRDTDPGGGVIVEFLDESNTEDFALLRRSLQFEDCIVASDAMPPVTAAGWADPKDWPLPSDVSTHPRTAGTYSRALRLWREEGVALIEALRRCTLLPAQVLEASVPAMARKGRVSVGADADLVVFDAAAVTDQATYADSTRPSTGISHVLVNGTFVVRDGALVPDARPGQPLRAS
jgi:N-acyl-D-aspartate/D-glutamate deacylase